MKIIFFPGLLCCACLLLKAQGPAKSSVGLRQPRQPLLRRHHHHQLPRQHRSQQQYLKPRNSSSPSSSSHRYCSTHNRPPPVAPDYGMPITSYGSRDIGANPATKRLLLLIKAAALNPQTRAPPTPAPQAPLPKPHPHRARPPTPAIPPTRTILPATHP